MDRSQSRSDALFFTNFELRKKYFLFMELMEL